MDERASSVMHGHVAFGGSLDPARKSGEWRRSVVPTEGIVPRISSLA